MSAKLKKLKYIKAYNIKTSPIKKILNGQYEKI